MRFAGRRALLLESAPNGVLDDQCKTKGGRGGGKAEGEGEREEVVEEDGEIESGSQRRVTEAAAATRSRPSRCRAALQARPNSPRLCSLKVTPFALPPTHTLTNSQQWQQSHQRHRGLVRLVVVLRWWKTIASIFSRPTRATLSRQPKKQKPAWPKFKSAVGVPFSVFLSFSVGKFTVQRLAASRHVSEPACFGAEMIGSNAREEIPEPHAAPDIELDRPGSIPDTLLLNLVQPQTGTRQECNTVNKTTRDRITLQRWNLLVVKLLVSRRVAEEPASDNAAKEQVDGSTERPEQAERPPQPGEGHGGYEDDVCIVQEAEHLERIGWLAGHSPCAEVSVEVVHKVLVEARVGAAAHGDVYMQILAALGIGPEGVWPVGGDVDLLARLKLAVLAVDEKGSLQLLALKPTSHARASRLARAASAALGCGEFSTGRKARQLSAR
ncbi:hypothetical protein L1887_58613 [Cichorium endivia]|nr:hypothetical protein L1887_58613 [Cichorium endivia]